MKMNENQVENLLSTHGDEILRRQRISQTQRQVNAQSRWKPVLVAGTVFFGLGIFVFFPRQADAKLPKIKNAIRGARSMEVQMFGRYNNGPWRKFQHRINQNGLSRYEGERPNGIFMTAIDDGYQTLQNYQKLPFAVLRKKDQTEKGESEAIDPLKEALAILDGNSDKSVYSYSTLQGKVVNGRETYVINYSRSDIQRTLKVIVDEETNLPIESFCRDEADPKRNIGVQEIHTTYLYNRSYDSALFSFKTGKRVIDLNTERNKLQKDWAQAKSVKGNAPIYASSITPDGTIWIAFGVESLDRLDKVPSEIVANGTTYIFSHDSSAAIRSINANFRIAGRHIVITSFVPIKEVSSLPTDAIVQFGSRVQTEEGQINAGKIGFIDRVENPQRVPLEVEGLNLPSYMATLGFDRSFIYESARLWKTKAEYHEKIGDLLGAGKAYEAEAEAWKNWVEYKGFEPLRKAAECYRQLGNLEKAANLSLRADKLEATRIR